MSDTFLERTLARIGSVRFRPLHFALSFPFIALVAAVDRFTGDELATGHFYLLPVLYSVPSGGRWGWVATAVAASGTLYVIDYIEHLYSHPLYPVFNGLWYLAVFLLVAWLYREVLDRAEEARIGAVTDPLTGAANRRFLDEFLRREIARMARTGSPMTVAFLDLDDFKAVNDNFGHEAGDILLERLVDAAAASLRETDVVARLGGDEFVFVFPETDAAGGEKILSRLCSGVRETLRHYGKPRVSFSIGAVTFLRPPPSPHDAIREADRRMYEAKAAGKDRTIHVVWPAAEPSSAPPSSAPDRNRDSISSRNTSR